jgi:hypothetical protein
MAYSTEGLKGKTYERCKFFLIYPVVYFDPKQFHNISVTKKKQMCIVRAALKYNGSTRTVF